MLNNLLFNNSKLVGVRYILLDKAIYLQFLVKHLIELEKNWDSMDEIVQVIRVSRVNIDSRKVIAGLVSISTMATYWQ